MTPAEIESAATTVKDLANHMTLLRQQANALADSFSTGERGFFTPSEDDAVTALWVSYNKARSALLELIDTIRAEVEKASDESITEFTLAYASAVLLVDAARFLRELFADDAIVRRKLNESFEGYGIAAGSFDAIQLSLTDPANAIKIREANQFYDDHVDAIRSLSESHPEVEGLLDIIEAAGDRTRVSSGRYVHVRIQERRHHLNEAIVQGGLARAVYAVQEWGSRLVSSISTMPRHIPKLPDAIATQLGNMLRPGDVFVTRKESAVTNYFLPGYWPHVAMYVGEDQVIESLKDGVRLRSLDSPFGNDAVCVIRPKLDEDTIDAAIKRAHTHIGKPYDFDFDFTRADRMVCTEVVYRSYEGLGGVQFSLSQRAGRQTIAAEDLLNLALVGDSFELIAVFCPSKCQELLIDSDRITDVMRDTMAAPAV